MPAIWNIGNISGYNNKKISSKLTFEEGETFKGMVVAKGNGDEDDSVVIRLTDGWQFPAELLEDSNFEGQNLVQFRVEGFEDGKIKLKIINDLKNLNENTDEDIVKDFMQKQGMNDDDLSVLKSMVKFNIPLTKENIEFVKTVFNFSQKVNSKEGIDDFINKYISGKGIEPQSPEAASIRDTLTDFFKAFKSMSQDEMLLFLENGIDINKENIESYNKLFKGDITLKEYFDNVSKDFADLQLEGNQAVNENSEVNAKVIEEDNQNTENKQNIQYSQKQNAGLKVYDDTTANKSRVSLLNLLRTVTGNENNVTKDTVKNILLENKNIFKGLELSDVFNKLDNMTEEEVKNVFKDYVQNDGLTKESLTAAFKDLTGKDIKLSNNEAAQLKEVLNFTEDDIESFKNNNQTENVKGENLNSNQAAKNQGEAVKNNNAAPRDTDIIKEGSESEKDMAAKSEKNLGKSVLQTEAKLTSSNIVKHEMNGKIESIKDVIKQIMSHSEELKSKNLETRVAEFIKGNINDFKLLNSLSNEYYYMDVPIDRNQNQYPCKLIIKDDRKGNKKIDSSNVKMVVAVKTINMGTVDAYLTVSGETLNVDIKCIDKFIKLLSSGTEQLSSKLRELGYFVNINVTEKADEVSLTSCRQFFDDGNTVTLDTKV